jgi:hypothetical protein
MLASEAVAVLLISGLLFFQRMESTVVGLV